jgi:hypothetical protein
MPKKTPKVMKLGGDILTDLAKQVIPMLLSGGQIRKLKKGGAITINPSMLSDVAETALSLLPNSAQKIMKNIGQNKGVRYVLKQGEDLINRVTGKGIFDSLKSVAKSVAPVASAVGKELAPIALDLGKEYVKKQVLSKGSGMGMRNRKKSVKSGCGSAYVSIPYKKALSNVENGGSIYPAGFRAGKGIYPAGMSGSGMEDMPIQLGSPYQSINSPAMNPFMPTHNPFRYNPIKRGSGIGEDILGGLQTAAKFAPLAMAFL